MPQWPKLCICACGADGAGEEAPSSRAGNELEERRTVAYKGIANCDAFVCHRSIERRAKLEGIEGERGDRHSVVLGRAWGWVVDALDAIIATSRSELFGVDIEIEGKITVTISYDKLYRRKTGAIFLISRRFCAGIQ